MGVIIVILFICVIVLIEELYKRKPKTHGISGALDWHIRNGVLYIDGDGPMENFSNSRRSPWHQNITGVEIGRGVTTIGDYAFSFCTKITEAVIPSNIRSIGQYAFSYCIGLKSVEIQNSPDSIRIDSGVFPSGVTVKFIENGRELYSYVVPDYEEDYNTGAEEEPVVTNAVSNTVNSSGRVSETAEPVCEEEPDPTYWKYDKSVLIISGSGAMKNYTAAFPAPWGNTFTSVVIEPGITSVGNYAFYNCTKLKSVVLPDTVTTIGDSAFAWCTSLQAVKLPKTLSGIGKAAFSCCSKLSAIEIPDSIAIPKDAFAYCDKLRGKLPRRQ